MTTATEMTVDQDLVLAESPVSVVSDIPYSRKFSIVSKIFGTEDVVKAYASDLVVDGGKVTLTITKKGESGRKVGHPFHFLTSDGVLLAWKRNKHRLSDSLALNHELFALEWNTSVILHDVGDEQMLFISSRDEWLKCGIPACLGEELQVVLKVPDHRLIHSSVLGDGHLWWISECLAAKRRMQG